jgi:chromosome segregation ATPase
MDQDLLAYLDQRFSSIDRRFEDTAQQIQTLREEMTSQFSRVDQRLGGMDQRLDRVDQRLGGMDQRLDRVDQRLDRVDQRLEGMDQRFDTLETDVRKTWVSIEDVRDQVRLVAEGVANNNEQLSLHRVEVARRFDELETLTHNAYAVLDERVRRLEATG